MHGAYSGYLLELETMATLKTWLSGCQLDLVNKLGGKHAECIELISNLCNKKKYILHYRNLKQCKSLCLNNTKIHRVVIFIELAWMTTYIQYTDQRIKAATGSFKKDHSFQTDK